MITLRRDRERRHVRRGRQNIWHTFYPQDQPDLLASGFGVLVLFDEMRLPPDKSTIAEPRDEAEVVSYVYNGALAQEDATGSSDVVHAGAFQRMTTGPGVRRKETNASRTDWAHVFRISLRPSEFRHKRTHEERRFTAAHRRNVLCLVASPDGRKESLHIHQDALIYSSILDSGRHLAYELLPGRSAWLHIVRGEATLNGIVLTRGDSAGITSEPLVSFTVWESSEVLLLDLGPAPRAHLEAEISPRPPARKKQKEPKMTGDCPCRQDGSHHVARCMGVSGGDTLPEEVDAWAFRIRPHSTLAMQERPLGWLLIPSARRPLGTRKLYSTARGRQDQQQWGLVSATCM